jgi:hypothetical protein
MTHPSSPSSTTPQGRRPCPAPAPRPAGRGLPLSVWPGLPAPCGHPDTGPCGGPVTTAAAARVIESFSRPGDLIAAPAGSPAAAAAGAAGRSFRAIPAAALTGRGDRAAWIRPGWPASPADLAIAAHCGHPCCAAPGDGPGGGLLLAACERLLRPGGTLAVITAGPDPAHPGTVVAAARAAGFLYTQHIVLLHAAIDGDRLDPGPAAPCGAAAHTDLLVFAKPGSRP